MQGIDKQYIFDEDGKAIAVQIPLDQFQEIEQTLSRSLVQEENGQDPAEESQDAELEFVDGVLVVKAQGTKISASVAKNLLG